LNLYTDASALLKQYVVEPGSRQTRALLELAEQLAASTITPVEVSSALVKSVRTKTITRNQASRALAAFQRSWSDFVQLEISEPIVERAVDLTWTHGLRAYDAVHLAAALFWQLGLDEKVTFATFDHLLWSAAQTEGLNVYPQEWSTVASG
jgi:predicted nucleic acid-binding protein